MMEYKGYTAKVDFDDDADIFHGEIINLRIEARKEGKGKSPPRAAPSSLYTSLVIPRLYRR